jgi:PAS domain S-box-containing protein
MSEATQVQRAGSKAAGSARGGDRYEKARYLAFAFCTADALLETDAVGNIVFANGATRHLFGYSPAEMAGKPLKNLAETAEQPLLRALLARAAAGERFKDVSVNIARPGAPNILLSLNGYGVPDLGNHCFLTASAADVRRDSVGNDERMPDSGLLTTAAFSDNVKAHFENADGSAHMGEMTIIGLTGLPELEERLSPGESKLLQRRLGSFLKAISLEGDSAAQLSDDQFGLLHDDKVDIESVKDQLSEFARAADPKGIGVAVEAETADVGEMDISGQDLASALLYTIQQVGQGGGAGAAGALSKNISQQLGETAENIALVKATIESGQFDIAFQSIVALDSRERHHFEALVRLNNSPVKMNPFEFICFAEDVGLIASFDLALCAKVIERVKSAATRGKVLPIAVNISGRSIDSDSFVESLRLLIKDNPEINGRLLFEITESARIQDLKRANEVIGSLRADGFEVCLDDFGAGEAAFEYLNALEVDYVKIDGQYVVNATASDKGRAFLIAMSGLCRDLGITTIAEFVETDEIVKFLLECGVAYGQGYLFDKPNVAADLSGAVVSKNARRKGVVESWG